MRERELKEYQIINTFSRTSILQALKEELSTGENLNKENIYKKRKKKLFTLLAISSIPFANIADICV